jgi:6-phosphogluconolactonase (cycloisomerase 2 family)
MATSDAGPMAKIKGRNHFVQAFSIAPDGILAPLGSSVRLRNRPLHLSLDPSEQHLLLAYNDPPDVTVHRVDADGAVGDEVPQQPLAFGPTVHQVMVAPHGTIAVVPACAHSEDGSPAGSVGIFRYRDGLLAPLASIEARPERAAPWRGVRNGAQGFAARHVDFHPTRPWMYLCVEAQGELHLYDYDADRVALEPRFITSTLAGAPVGRSAQLASAVHVHPDGRFVYVSNRAWDTEPVDGHDVFIGGVNDIAVFAIDQDTGEPSLLQHVESQGIFPRTFGIDASGTLLVVGNQDPTTVRNGAGLRKVLPSLVLFRIGPDGRLTFLSKVDHRDNGEVCFWVDVLTLDRMPS